MKGLVEKQCLDRRECVVYIPPSAGRTSQVPTVYANGAQEEQMLQIIPKLESAFCKGVPPFALIGVGAEWERDFSPWPAPAAFHEAGDFPGGAGQYLAFLCQTLKPWVDQRYPTLPQPAHTGICGYSLGGLAALYALYSTNTFGAVASISGSLWYEGFLTFMDSHPPMQEHAQVWLSLGRAEEKTRHRLLRRIGDCTREAQAILSRQLGHQIPLVWNDGGHSTQVPARKLAALLWLAEQIA